MICPQCHSRETMVTADDRGLCFDCRYTWDPNSLAAIPPPVIEPFAMASVDEVFGPPPDYPDHLHHLERPAGGHHADDGPNVEPSEPPFVLDDLIGQLAHLEGGQVVMVSGIVDDDHLEVFTASRETLTVAFADVERIVPIPETYDLDEDRQGDQQAGGTT